MRLRRAGPEHWEEVALPQAVSWQCSDLGLASVGNRIDNGQHLDRDLASVGNRINNGQHLFVGQRVALITSPAEVGPSLSLRRVLCACIVGRRNLIVIFMTSLLGV
jgi:hypothetical protein